MRASQFEIQHPLLLHLLIVVAGWATYLWDREDIVWRLIRDSPSQRLLEHVVFSFATVLIGAGAVLSTRSRAAGVTANTNSSSLARSGLFGEWLYAIGLATLLPLWGCAFLIAAESLRLLRLALNREAPAQLQEQKLQRLSRQRWTGVVRREFVKWGLFLTMIIFSVCLVDRIADYGILASVLLWGLLNMRATHLAVQT